MHRNATPTIDTGDTRISAAILEQPTATPQDVRSVYEAALERELERALKHWTTMEEQLTEALYKARVEQSRLTAKLAQARAVQAVGKRPLFGEHPDDARYGQDCRAVTDSACGDVQLSEGA